VLLSDSVVVADLHVAEDAKTLVRTIVDLSVVNVAATGEADYSMMIMRSEKSVAVITPAVTQLLDSTVPIALIWEKSGDLDQRDDTGPSARQDVFVDLKSMRKMKEGDTIELAHVASAASIVRLVGVITLFFKE